MRTFNISHNLTVLTDTAIPVKIFYVKHERAKYGESLNIVNRKLLYLTPEIAADRLLLEHVAHQQRLSGEGRYVLTYISTVPLT